MVGFGDPETPDRPVLDGVEVLDIHPDLTSGLDLTGKQYLSSNAGLCFMGTTKVGAFDLPAQKATALLVARNPEPLPNSDVLRPFRNGSELVRERSDRWIVDFGVGQPKESATRYRLPFQHVVENVQAERERNNDPWRRAHWWLLGRTLPDFRAATSGLTRYVATARVAKHRLFVWLDSVVLPDSKLIAIAFEDDYRFGVLHSRIHAIWTGVTQAWHGGERPTYNPTECFETFPFPFTDDLRMPQRATSGFPFPIETADQNGGLARMVARRFLEVREEPPAFGTGRTHPLTPWPLRAAIAAAAKELIELRERWLNPPEWTETRVLGFPGTVGGPWDRYIDPSTLNPQRSTGLVRYPRLEPRDADCAAKLKKRALTNLYNERPGWLDLAHRRLDAAVAAAYGWPADLSEEQFLGRLLALNLERAAQEQAAAKAKKPRATRGKLRDQLL